MRMLKVNQPVASLVCCSYEGALSLARVGDPFGDDVAASLYPHLVQNFAFSTIIGFLHRPQVLLGSISPILYRKVLQYTSLLTYNSPLAFLSLLAIDNSIPTLNYSPSLYTAVAGRKDSLLLIHPLRTSQLTMMRSLVLGWYLRI